jgi:hypothetical protein
MSFSQKIKEVFGYNYQEYSSVKAQELFLDSQLKVSAKLLWAPLGVVFSIITGKLILITVTMLLGAVMIVLALNLRHKALMGFDQVELRKQREEKAKVFRNKRY